MRIRFLALTMTVLLAACGNGKDQRVLPTGPVTETGTVVSVDLSLVRRGTHQIVVRGTPVYFLESAAVNLQQFEGQTVGVTGTVSANVSPEDLPVLKVEAVSTTKAPAGVAVTLQNLGMKLSVPATWVRKDDGPVVVFTSSGGQTLLKVAASTLIALPEDGVLSLIGGQKASKTVAVDGTQEFTVQLPSRFVRIELPPFSTAEFALIDERDAVMKSISFPGASQQQTSQAASADASAPSTYCGGGAGILCPSGSVCIITDPKENIGYCSVVGKPQ